MADLAAHTIHETRPRSGRDSFPIADGVTVYAGMLAQLEGGHINHWDDDAANDVFVGLLIGGDDRANDGVLLGETGDSPDPQAHIDTSGVVLMHLDSVDDTPAQSEVGDLIYASSSNTDDMTLLQSSLTSAIGWMCRFRSSTDVDVRLFTPEEYIAHNYVDTV